MIKIIYSLFIILNVNILNYVYSEKFVANYFYQNNDCKDLNFIMYTYENYEVCEVLNDTLCNGYGTYSNTQSCGENSLENTQLLFTDYDFLYYDIYDINCTNKINTISIKVDKCISFMDTIYIKITKNSKFYNTGNYVDPECTEEYNYKDSINPESESIFNLSTTCTEKIKFYNKDGEIPYNNEIFQDINKKNNGINSINNINSIIYISIILVYIILFY